MSALKNACTCGQPKTKWSKKCRACYKKVVQKADPVVVHRMYEADGMTMKAIAKQLGVSSAAISAILMSLDAKVARKKLAGGHR